MRNYVVDAVLFLFFALIFIGHIALTGIVALIIITVLPYFQHRTGQQCEKRICEKNTELERLIAENDWLLKEVHHRIKNNLQTVVSLLESQSAYLKNTEALSAIQDSQNRVNAMSLIHQKLYQPENVSSINMEVYLRELLTYLRDSFRQGHSLRFSIQVDSIELDVTQAIPVGLILNEAITNAIKYAFPVITSESLISISMNQDTSRKVSLSIADNGHGLPENFDIESDQCGLGLKLMKGLTEDIDGEFRITSIKGVTININFNANIPFHRSSNAKN